MIMNVGGQGWGKDVKIEFITTKQQNKCWIFKW